MSEFSDRIAAQRHLLQVVNQGRWKEELFGLSSKAIDRWSLANNVSPDANLAVLLRNAGSKLFCLATRSQEQVSEEYGKVSSELTLITAAIQGEIDRI
jgi:hypothetical protein